MLKEFLNKVVTPKVLKFYLSINLKPKPLRLDENEKCLLLAPHADDESIGAAGLLIKHPSQFEVICLTNGAKGIKNLGRDEAVAVRKEEFQNAMEKAKVKSFQIFDIEDKELILNYEKFKIIDIKEFDYIFIPNLLDQHLDHKAVSVNLKRLLKEKQHKSSLKIAMYEVWSALPMPNAYLDISDIVTLKKQMINEHKSQIATKDYTSKIIGLNEYRGLPHNLDFAESFLVLDVVTFNKIVDIN